jgi:hypothetical protein
MFKHSNMANDPGLTITQKKNEIKGHLKVKGKQTFNERVLSHFLNLHILERKQIELNIALILKF